MGGLDGPGKTKHANGADFTPNFSLLLLRNTYKLRIFLYFFSLFQTFSPFIFTRLRVWSVLWRLKLGLFCIFIRRLSLGARRSLVEAGLGSFCINNLVLRISYCVCCWLKLGSFCIFNRDSWPVARWAMCAYLR